MAANKQFRVDIAFDDDAKVYFVAHSDIPGLSLEAKTIEALEDAIRQAAPDLLALNRDKWDGGHNDAPKSIIAHYEKSFALAC